jgi:hypothetical protein
VNLNVILHLEMKPPKMRLNKTHLFPPEIRKKKQPAIYGSKKLFAYSSKLAIVMKARLLEFLWAKN